MCSLQTLKAGTDKHSAEVIASQEKANATHSLSSQAATNLQHFAGQIEQGKDLSDYTKSQNATPTDRSEARRFGH